ncbi:MAG: T9SS type A sorting domain-containing protein [Ignavibacteria bacterium]|nr:T9SS type A sorting domain-containing protein [Ignavibacteria bacterium]
MKKAILLSCVMLLGFFMFTGQVMDKGQKVDGSFIWNFHKLQKWYQMRGILLPSTYPLAPPQISPIFQVDGMDQSDVQVYSSSNYQTENSIGINPINYNNLMVSFNELSGQPYFFSTNGGSTWFGSESNPNGIANFGDPVAFFNHNGKAFWSTLKDPGGIGFASTTNNGVTWVTLGNGDPSASANDDKQHAICDLSGTYPSNVYTAWTDFTSTPYPLYINRSTDEGVTWGTKINISLPSPHFNHGVTLASGPNGEVYVAWADYSSGSLPETGMGFTKSTNGGVSYSTSVTAFTMTGIRTTNSGVAEFNNTRVNSFPKMDVDRSAGPRRGWIYIVYPDKNTGDADVYLRRSTDGGTTWSSAIRVNGETVGNGKQQWMPSIGVDATNGIVGVSYYSMDTTGFLTARYMATSVDGGTTWDRTKVSDVRFTPVALPAPYAGGYCGDYYETAAGGGSIWACWSDNRTGTYFQAYTSRLTVGPSITHTPLTNTEQTTGNRAVNCTIAPAGSGINPSTTKLYYAKNSSSFTSIALTNSSGTNWTANLPLSGAGTYNYYLTTTDSLSRTATSPGGAPASYYTFTATADTVKPVITHTAIGNTAKNAWPVSVTANVTDNIGIDSVWVRWYKNNTGTGVKQFKLPNTAGTTYSASFNSVNSDVAIGDSIFYRIIAQDNSSNHNRDSSSLIRFKIINLKICEDFSGGVVPPTGWTVSGTYWKYNSVSGYGAGTGSAQFNFWSASAGTNEMLTSLTFDPTIAGDSIKFDIAHALYNTSIDSLIVEASVNAGTTWTSIAPMYAGSTYTAPLCMSTTSSTSQFTPTASQWKSRAFVLPAGTNKVRFRAKSGFGNDLFIDNLCQSSTVTGVTPITLTSIPTDYSLKQNYPNPFNPTTKINFAIPKQGLVTMKIYDVLGREVRTLVNEIKQVGNYSVEFNASDLASGVYFYKLDAGTFSDIKRMILIK